jgi:hypothetical protein
VVIVPENLFSKRLTMSCAVSGSLAMVASDIRLAIESVRLKAGMGDVGGKRGDATALRRMDMLLRALPVEDGGVGGGDDVVSAVCRD